MTMSSSYKEVQLDDVEVIVENMEPSRVLNSLVASSTLDDNDMRRIRSYLTTSEKNQQVRYGSIHLGCWYIM